ncbi:MAG: energy transducer TonB, partial [Gammaproteobacteria bacterium]|nr:energy transducer TonB [Gammaproteobacteria bacterium]MCW8927760.1 energy transducer TonB [Gammaproteobacteria bacterium]MCW8959538.1 energy transducer TonB [Gammaproteobacteria bacterium]
VTTSSLPIKVSASDRLGLTLFLAVAVHALLILGISFDFEQLVPREIPISLEITLVHSSDREKPDDADYLAQASQKGGGNVEEKLRPSSPAFNPLPNEDPGDAEQNTPMVAPPPQQVREETLVMTTEADSPTRIEQPEQSPRPQTPEAPTAAELLNRSRSIARLSAQIEQRQQAYAQKGREKTITASTSEYRYAAYMDAWRQKVERIGNLNYPDEAKRRGLNGHLTLDVALRPDGSVASIEVIRSSGHKILDDGAIRIVKLAAPFNAFPPEVRKETDILHIIRVWQFQNDSFQQTRR